MSDRLALSLLNRRQLRQGDFETRDGGAVLLSEAARKTVLTAWQERNPVEWRVNATQVASRNGRALDGTDAAELSYGEIEGRRQAQAFMSFLRSNRLRATI